MNLSDLKEVFGRSKIWINWSLVFVNLFKLFGAGVYLVLIFGGDTFRSERYTYALSLLSSLFISLRY